MTNGMCGADVRWRLEWDAQENGTLIIFGNGPMNDYSLGLPPWEFDKDTITAIAIEEGVTHVGAFSFNECVELVSLSLPISLQSVGEGAFAGCVCLELQELPPGVSTVGPDAFEGCSGLTGSLL